MNPTRRGILRTALGFGRLSRQSEESAERRAATANLLKATADVEPDALIARWDIVLTGG